MYRDRKQTNSYQKAGGMERTRAGSGDSTKGMGFLSEAMKMA